MSSWLETISARLPCDALALGAEELGAQALEALAGLNVASDPLILLGAKPVRRQPKLLAISGSGRGLFGGDGVALELLLIEATENRREWLILARQPAADGASASALDDAINRWLSLFKSEPDVLFTALASVTFCLVSSADFTRKENREEIELPNGWAPLPLDEICAGVTLAAEKVAYDQEIADGLHEWVGIKLLKDGAATLRGIAASSPEGPILSVRPREQAEGLVLPWFAAEQAAPEILVPLMPGEWSGPLFRQSGKLTFPTGTGASENFRNQSYTVEAEFDIRRRTTTARFSTPPGFGVFREFFGDLPSNDLAGSLLKGVIGEAWVVRDWRPKGEPGASEEAVLALGGAVGWRDSDPIVLIPDRLTLVGALSFQVEHPFTPETRQASGRMEGTLRLLQDRKVAASLSASLEFPGWFFRARAEATNLGELWQAFGSDVQLPDVLRSAQISVELWGEALSSSFGAEIQFASDSKWPGSGPGFSWALERISLSVGYGAGAFEFGIEAGLAVEDMRFEVAGGYEQAGWYLQGGMTPGTTLDVSKAINSLLKGLELPDAVPPDLKLADVRFAANFNAGYISLGGRTDGYWPIADGIRLGIQALSFERDRQQTNASLIVSLDLDGVFVLLEASKTEGWLFKGGTAPGTQIRFAAVYAKLSRKTEQEAKDTLPDALKDFTVDAVTASYNTASKAFAAACSGHLTI